MKNFYTKKISSKIYCAQCAYLNISPIFGQEQHKYLSILKKPSRGMARYYCKSCAQTGIIAIPLSEVL